MSVYPVPRAPCLSGKLQGHIVTDGKSTLLAFEAMCKKGEQNPLLLDYHLPAFFPFTRPPCSKKSSINLNAPSKDERIVGNLRFWP